MVLHDVGVLGVDHWHLAPSTLKSCVLYFKEAAIRSGCSIRHYGLQAAISSFSGLPSLAVRHVHRQAAQRGFFILLVHIDTGLAHGFNAGVKADQMFAVAVQDEAEVALKWRGLSLGG